MLYSEQECMVSTSKTGVCVCALLQCMAGRAEAQHSASPSLVDEPRRRPASLKHSLLRSPAEDPAGPDTQENAAHQKQGQVVHSECGNRSSDDDAAIHAHYPNQVRAVPANMCRHIPCTVCASFGRCPTPGSGLFPWHSAALSLHQSLHTCSVGCEGPLFLTTAGNQIVYHHLQ